MAITELTADEPSPAFIVKDGQAATFINSGSFSPPAGSLVTVQFCWCMGNSGDSVTTNTVTDSNSVSYTKGVSYGGAASGDVAGIFFHYYATAPGSVTVQGVPADSGGSGQTECVMLVQVWSGCASSQTGAATGGTENSTGSTTLTSSITTTTAGSLVLVAANHFEYNQSNHYAAYDANTTLLYQDQPALTIGESVVGQAASLTGTPGAITLGYTIAGGVANPWSVSLLEILPAAGGPAVAFPGAVIVMPGQAWTARWDPTGKPRLAGQYQAPVIAYDGDTGHGTDAGEIIGILPASAETGHGTDAGELTAATPGDSDSSNAAADAGEVIGIKPVTGDASGPAADAGEVITVTGADSSAAAVDAGERVVVVASDSCHGTDAGETSLATLSDSDSSNSAIDAGEGISATTAQNDVALVPPSWTARYRHTSRPLQIASRSSVVAISDTDACQGTDGTETAGVTDGDAAAGTDAGELVVLLAVVSATARPGPSWWQRFGFSNVKRAVSGQHQATYYITDTDSAYGTDSGYTGATDFCHGEDSGFTVVADSDSCTGTDNAETLHPQDSDASGPAADLELTSWPRDRDSVTGTDAGCWSGPLADTDAGHGTESVLPFLFSDSDTCTGDDEGPAIDVYSFQPPFRWTGAGYEVVFRGRVLWRGEHPDKAALELALALERGAELVIDSDTAHGWDEEDPAIAGASITITPALAGAVIVIPAV